MIATILLTLTFLLLTGGLTLHDEYLERKLDKPCRFSGECHARSESARARFLEKKWKARIQVKAEKL
jgi:hypothetical protein